MNSKRKISYLILQVLFAALLVAIVLFQILDGAINNRDTGFDSVSGALDEWTIIGDDGSEKDIVIPYRAPDEYGDTVTMRTTLPHDLRDENYIAFYISKDCTVYIGDEERFNFDHEDAEVFGGQCKPAWQFVRVSSKDADASVTIVWNGAQDTNGTFLYALYGDMHSLVSRYFSGHLVYYYCVFILAAIALGVIFVSVLMRAVFHRRIDIIWMALGIFLADLWLLFDSPMFQLFFNNRYMDGPLTYMTLLTMPFPILLYIDFTMKFRKEHFLVPLMYLSAANAVILFILHFTGIRNFQDCMYEIAVVIGVITVIAVAVIFADIFEGNLHEYYVTASGMLLFLFLSLVGLFALITVRGMTDRVYLLIGMYILVFSGIVQQLIAIHTSEREKAEAVEANLQKSNFLANMSHEIRTPINSIIGMNEMILRESREPEIKEYAHLIEGSGRLLLGLINDVLDFSKIEAGKFEIIQVEFDTADFINDIVVLTEDRARSKNLETRFDISERLPKKLKGDDLHIKQILINLISNAVKYTKEGSVSVSVSELPSMADPSRSNIKFVIKDTGIGIKKESIPQLFDSFSRFDEVRNRGIEGTGLGLSIVKRLVDIMNGTVMVESEYGRGSTFTVVLPLEVVDREPLGNFAEAIDKAKSTELGYTELFRAPDAKLLVVDDNMVNQRVVCELLKRTEISIDTAGGGLEAVSMCRKKKYDLVLMDHMMPEPDGIATLHLIREDQTGLNRETPVIVLTANAFAGLRDKYRAEGFEDYLTKPIDSALLERKVLEFIPQRLILRVPDMKHMDVRQDKADKDAPRDNGSRVNDTANTDNTDNTRKTDKEQDKGGIKMSFAESIRRVEGMDYEAASAQFGGNDDFMRSLLETVIVDGREKIDLMHKYLAEKDYTDYGIEAHAAKSTLATIAAKELSDHAKKHEFAAKENNIAYIEEDSEAFIEAYADILNRIEQALNDVG